MNKTKSNRKGKVVQPPPDNSKRKFMLLGLGGAGALAVAGIGYGAGWFGSSPASSSLPIASPTPNLATGKPLPPVTLTANYQNALAAANELTSFYARELNNASTLIHGVRAFGKNFKLNDGSLAVDFLCSRFAAEKEINGKRYVYFTREAEVHEFSFLKTMLEAGVSPDQPVTAGGRKYTLRDVGESAKSLFRCDPKNFDRYEVNYLGRHLPWALIAFSILVPPSQSTWVNAYGETINLPEIIDASFAVLSALCADVNETSARGELESLEFRKGLKKFSCDGMHSAYSYYSCLHHGFTGNDMQGRINKLTDSILLRLREDSLAIDREADAVKSMGPDFIGRIALEDQGKKLTTKGAPPPALAEVMRFRFQIIMLGHALEALNYAKLHKLIKLTPAQEGKQRAGEQMLYEYLVKLRATDLQPYLAWHEKFVGETVIALAHAARGLKLLTPENPDTAA
jgi:hypothetical protein